MAGYVHYIQEPVMPAVRLPLVAAFAALIALPLAHAQDKAKSSALTRADRSVIEKLAEADMAEIEAGKLAAQKGTHPEVKKFGQHMVDEHGKMLEEGKTLAQSKGVKPPSGPSILQKANVKKLELLSDSFDRQYIEQMVKDHDEVLKLAQKAAAETRDAELKAHLQKGEPHIKEHLAAARKLQDQLEGASGSSSEGKGKGASGRK
jgi:putative membrane protein